MHNYLKLAFDDLEGATIFLSFLIWLRLFNSDLSIGGLGLTTPIGDLLYLFLSRFWDSNKLDLLPLSLIGLSYLFLTFESKILVYFYTNICIIFWLIWKYLS